MNWELISRSRKSTNEFVIWVVFCVVHDKAPIIFPSVHLHTLNLCGRLLVQVVDNDSTGTVETKLGIVFMCMI